MDLNAAIDIIIKDLHEAGEIIDDLKKYPGVPEFQVELAKSKCNSASEVIALLKKLQVRIPEKGEEKKTGKGDTLKEEPSEEKVITKPVAEPTVSKPVEVRANETVAVSNKEATQHISRPVESGILADQFSNRPESYNERLSTIRQDEDVLEILKTRPLSSLTEAIGINDKFLFVREIFNGNQENYEQAINKLESVGSLSDAMAVVMSYTGEKTSNEAVRQLLELIKRKFPPNE
jgi:copper chaperone CopZ